MKPITLEPVVTNTDHIVPITANGEVSLDTNTMMYTVYDENWSDVLIETNSLDEALDKYREYGEYLNSL